MTRPAPRQGSVRLKALYEQAERVYTELAEKVAQLSTLARGDPRRLRALHVNRRRWGAPSQPRLDRHHVPQRQQPKDKLAHKCDDLNEVG